MVHYGSVNFFICLLLLALIDDWLLLLVFFTGVLYELLLVNRDVVLDGLAFLADVLLRIVFIK